MSPIEILYYNSQEIAEIIPCKEGRWIANKRNRKNFDIIFGRLFLVTANREPPWGNGDGRMSVMSSFLANFPMNVQPTDCQVLLNHECF